MVSSLAATVLTQANAATPGIASPRLARSAMARGRQRLLLQPREPARCRIELAHSAPPWRLGASGVEPRESVLCWQVTRQRRSDPMRMAIARTLLGILLVTSVGASLGACSHTWQGAKDDFHSDTGK